MTGVGYDADLVARIALRASTGSSDDNQAVAEDGGIHGYQNPAH